MGNAGKGDPGKTTNSDWLRRSLMTLMQAGGGAERASNHTAFVVEQLGRAIVAGEYPADTMIPLDPDLCEMFGVSRTVVREAKKTLIAKGLIQSKAKVGTHVRPADEWNMFDQDVMRWHAAVKNPTRFYEELFEIRMIFEPAAAAQAAGRVNQLGCEELYRLCDQIAAATSRADFALADYAFHKQVLKMSGNRFLQSLGDLVQTALYSLFMSESNRDYADRRESVAEHHRAIVAAIASGTPDAAREAMGRVIHDGYWNAIPAGRAAGG
ncbi:MAG: FadR/GntR family transcriptional regulator [Sagittula sp.]|uniref:FadR/GntR family transcriptional regulator n=2 Tax=unclassified Sagittula TaxID=2624628 RepID=UPI0024C2A891|nr:FadR/GntR family transcriptional regulator [Sagittula sp. MA-2]WHZ37356.1 FadR/GntR family transcriptional regulator [Sagittula sp. MA-2]